jgi:hypothetical protein
MSAAPTSSTAADGHGAIIVAALMTAAARDALGNVRRNLPASAVASACGPCRCMDMPIAEPSISEISNRAPPQAVRYLAPASGGFRQPSTISRSNHSSALPIDAAPTVCHVRCATPRPVETAIERAPLLCAGGIFWECRRSYTLPATPSSGNSRWREGRCREPGDQPQAIIRRGTPPKS